MINNLKEILRQENGATAIEYAMIAAFISIIIVSAVSLLGTNLEARFQAVVTAFGG